MNTKIYYQYRDTSNYKVMNTVVFRGEFTRQDGERLKTAIAAPSGDELGQFVPGQVGLQDLQNAFYDMPIKAAEALREGQDPDDQIDQLIGDMKASKPMWWPDDGPFHELLMLELTSDEPDDPRDISTVIQSFVDTEWDEDYRPPFHAEMVQNYEAHVAAENASQDFF